MKAGDSAWFRTLLELQIKSHDWMYGYNTKHAHSALGYLTPEEFLPTYETIHFHRNQWPHDGSDATTAIDRNG